MNDPGRFGNTPIPGAPLEDEAPHREPIDWKTVAPRWALVVALGASLLGVGSLGTQLVAEKSERQARIEAALADTPTRYQSRLSERVAVLETQQFLLIAAVDKLTGQFDRQAAATNDLTAQMRVLTAELKRGRYR